VTLQGRGREGGREGRREGGSRRPDLSARVCIHFFFPVLLFLQGKRRCLYSRREKEKEEEEAEAEAEAEA